MLRLSSLLIFAAFLAYGLAQTTTTAEPTTTEAEATTTEETKATTTEAKPTTHTTEAPAPTTQPPPPPGNYSYSDANGTCMNVIGNMTLSVTYENETEKHVHLTVDLSDPDSMAIVNPDNSSCSSSSIQTFGFEFKAPNDPLEQFITITFRSENNAWNASEVTFNFNTASYPDLNVSTQEFLEFKAKGNLFQTNVDLGNSYSCGNAELTFNSADIDYKLNATLTIDRLQVQAFYTREMTRGDLGAAQDCASSKGNKIVPIAVGAALAGLVIVVLIAYLIGRLKSRKQSSYEALS